MNRIAAIAQVVLLEMLRRKDVYVLLVITGGMTLLLGAVNIFNEAKMVRYIKELCLLLIWISSIVIAVTAAARQIPNERENRTLFPLLAKPVSRTEVLLGKFFGCWGASAAALLLLYLAFLLLTGLRSSDSPLLQYFQAYLLHTFALGVITALTLLGSMLFASVAANATVCFFMVAGILLFARYLKQFSTQMTEPAHSILLLLYYFIPHLEVFDIRDLVIHSWPLIKWSSIASATLYGGAYIFIFLAAAAALFRRKAIN